MPKNVLKEAHGLGGVQTEFWCNVCDGNKVDSQKPETGKFFYASGHIWHGIQVDEPVGDHTMIILAVCCDCLPS